jgi:hypothetical protein
MAHLGLPEDLEQLLVRYTLCHHLLTVVGVNDLIAQRSKA